MDSNTHTHTHTHTYIHIHTYMHTNIMPMSVRTCAYYILWTQSICSYLVDVFVLGIHHYQRVFLACC